MPILDPSRQDWLAFPKKMVKLQHLNTVELSDRQRFTLAKAVIEQRIATLKIYAITSVAFGVLLGLMVTGITISQSNFESSKKEKVFGEQLKVYKDIASLVGSKDERKLREVLGYPETIEVNADYLLRKYFHKLFGTPKPSFEEVFSGAMLTLEDLPAFDDLLSNENEVAQQAIEQGIQPGYKLWALASDDNRLKLYVLAIGDGYMEHVSSLSELKESPFVTTKACALIDNYLNAALVNLEIIGEMVNSASDKFDSRYSSPDDLDKEYFSWLHNQIYSELIPLKPEADAITGYFKEKWGVEGL